MTKKSRSEERLIVFYFYYQPRLPKLNPMLGPPP
jgi:hypothetical protein